MVLVSLVSFWYQCMDSQAVDDGASLSTFLLPVVHLGQQAEEGFLGVGNVTVR